MKLLEAIETLLKFHWKLGYAVKEIVMLPEIRREFEKEIAPNFINKPEKHFLFDILVKENFNPVKIFTSQAGHFQFIIEPKKESIDAKFYKAEDGGK